MNISIVFLEVTTIMLFTLALRLKLWQRSGTTFLIIFLMFCLFIFNEFGDHALYIKYHPVILSAFLFIITLRAVFKERNDKIFGDLHRKDRRKGDVKHVKS